MKKFYKEVCLSIFVLAFVAAGSTIFSLSDQASSNIHITLRDSVTGGRVQGQVTFTTAGDTATAVATDDAGRGSFRLLSGRNDLHISAPGYNTLDTYFEGGRPALDVTAWLDPLGVPSEMRAEAVESRLRPGSTFVHGHIIDEKSGKPLGGARVYLANAHTEAVSDGRGYFQMNVPTPPIEPAGDLPGSDDLVVESGGKFIYRRNNILLPDGAVHFIIDADRNEAVIKDATHTLIRNHGEVRTGSAISSSNRIPESGRGDSETQGRRDVRVVGNTPATPSSVIVPTSIRVGFTCPTSTTCSSVQVYALDTYVRLGLDDEWISSWNTNSLKAGAIAFRSYGVYHVFHPKTATYDICSTTSCQVIDPNDSAASVDTATAQTTGSIVTDAAGANPFFAEYAAENNANLCPDGMTGNNGTGHA